MALIVAEKISKTYQIGEIAVQALKDVSFTIEPASFVSFVGPSGSGKTTLLNLIGCLDKPTERDPAGRGHRCPEPRPKPGSGLSGEITSASYSRTST